MDSAKLCFLLIAGFRIVIYAVVGLSGGLSALTIGALPPWVVAMTVFDIALPLFAAWRLHLYKGAFVAPVATALYVLGIAMAPTVGAVIIGALFTAVFVGGIRGAWALRGGKIFEDDHVATFS